MAEIDRAGRAGGAGGAARKPPAPAELATLRAMRDYATVVLDQGARDGRYVPTDWLTDAARGIRRLAEGATHPMIKGLGADAAKALAEAETKTGRGEAAAVLTAFLQAVEARLPIKK